MRTSARVFASQQYYQNKLKLAIIGQSVFGQEVYSSLRRQGHKVVGVFTVPDKDGKADPLGESTPSCLINSTNKQTNKHLLRALRFACVDCGVSEQRAALKLWLNISSSL